MIVEGYPIGFAIGIGVGIAVSSATKNSHKKLEKQLLNAMIDKEVSILNKDGKRMTVKQLFELIDENYK